MSPAYFLDPLSFRCGFALVSITLSLHNLLRLESRESIDFSYLDVRGGWLLTFQVVSPVDDHSRCDWIVDIFIGLLKRLRCKFHRS